MVNLAADHLVQDTTNPANTSNSRPWRSIGSFMYIGSAGPGPGGRTGGRCRTEDGRADGRRAGGRTGRNRFSMILMNDSATIFIDVQRFSRIVQRFPSNLNDFAIQYNDFHRCLQKILKKHSVFLSFRIRRKRKYRCLLQNCKPRPKKMQHRLFFIDFCKQ